MTDQCSCRGSTSTRPKPALLLRPIYQVLSPDGLEVTLEKRVLSIYGRVDEEAPEGYSMVYREYEVGDFERQFTLSGDFDINGIEADLKDGMLHLAIPRAPEPEAKRIEVRTSS